MKIALVQMQMVDDTERNYAASLDAIRAAAGQGADIVCFPELQFCRFFPQFPGQDATSFAQTLDDPKIKEIQRLCRELCIIAVPNFYLREGDCYFDASLVIDTTGVVLGVSKMVHIAQAPCFYEQDYYTPSDSGFKVYDTSKGKIGIVVCFDRHYPESIRKCATLGAELVIVPTANTRAEPMELFAWEMRVAAYQNNVFIAMCNRSGREDAMDFAGESIVCDPNGGIVYKAGYEETLGMAEIDLVQVKTVRKQRPYLSLLRPEYY